MTISSTNPPPTLGAGEPDVLACLVKLVAIYDGFLTCNDGFMGNHSEAYWHLHKAAQREWSEARLAISKALTPQASEDREEGVGS